MNVAQLIIHGVHNTAMTLLYRPLEVLSQAVHYKNLTAASAQVGLSQPQLSRLVGQIEQELNVVLLDRAAKRKAAWTPTAYRLAEAFTQSARRLQSAIQEVQLETQPSELHVASLEGLVGLAVAQLGRVVQEPWIHLVQFDVLDQNELEEKFLAGDLDVIWAARVPGRAKLRHVQELGYQSVDEKDSGRAIDIYSGFEFAQRRKRAGHGPARQTLISNSLLVRELWFKHVGGRGLFPSAVAHEKQRGQAPVLMIGSETLHQSIWARLTA